MNEVFDYDAFISFSSQDVEIVKPIWQEMAVNGLRVFWSDSILRNELGDSWFDVIENSLERSRHLILICTSNSMNSKWVQREYKAFYNHCYKAGLRKLIPIMMENFKVAELPLFLRELQVFNHKADQSVNEIINLISHSSLSQLKKLLAEKEEENKMLHNLIDEMSSTAKINTLLGTQLEDCIKQNKKLSLEIEELKKRPINVDNTNIVAIYKKQISTLKQQLSKYRNKLYSNSNDVSYWEDEINA